MPDALRHFFLKQPLLLPAMGCGLGIWYAQSGWTWVLILALVCYLVACRLSRLISILTGAAAMAGFSLHQYSLHQLEQMRSHVGERVELLGVVHEPPKPSRNFRQVVVLNVRQSSIPAFQNQRVLADFSRREKLRVGEKIWLQGMLNSPTRAMNPAELDRAPALRRKGISVVLKPSKTHNTHEIALSHTLYAKAEQSRQWIRQRLTLGIEAQQSSAIILAMFLGEKPPSSSEVMQDFVHSGTIHVFAVSGMHVMMIGLLFALALRFIGMPLLVWVPVVIGIMFFYAFVTGMRPPAMRAAIMGATVLSSLLISRRASLGNSLWLSALIALLWNSHSLFSPGFQLSYAVLASIVFTGKWWSQRFSRLSALDPFMPQQLLSWQQKLSYALRSKSAATLSVSSSAWCGSSLLIWLYFGLITPVAILASLPMVIAVFAILSTCCLTLTLGSMSDSIATQLNKLNIHHASAAGSISHYFAHLPYSHYKSKPWQQGERVVIYSLPDGGGACYISIGGGVMLDAGGRSTFYQNILPSLKKNGARIDSLIATHGDSRHVSGLVKCAEQFPIRQLMISSKASRSRSKSLKRLNQLAVEKGISIIHPQSRHYALTDSATLEVICAGDIRQSLADDRCVIVMLHWQRQKILFLGDSGFTAEKWLHEHRPDLTADIIVLGKHSQEPALSSRFINHLQAHTVIASHVDFPQSERRSQKWITDLRQSKIKLYLLNQSGAITITITPNTKSDSSPLKLEAFIK